jgi:hypothetical protein
MMMYCNSVDFKYYELSDMADTLYSHPIFIVY